MTSNHFSNLLHDEVVTTSLNASNKFQALQELLELLVSSHDLSTRQLGSVRDTLFRQERSKSSGSSSGLAFVHAQVPGLTLPVAALGISSDGIDFGGPSSSSVVLLSLSPSGSKGSQADSFVEINSMQKDGKTVAAIAGCSRPEEIRKYFQSH